MPETSYLGFPSDEERLVRLAFQLGMEIVPNLRYSSRELPVIGNWGDYELARLDTSLFFLFSTGTCVSPFRTERFAGEEVFYIKQRYGGPYVMLLSYLPYDADGVTIVPASSIGYYPSFYNSLTGEVVRPSAGFKALFKSLNAAITDHAECITVECVEGGVRHYWLSREAKAALEAGAKPGVDGFTIPKGPANISPNRT
jgi:hypothetical protein